MQEPRWIVISKLAAEALEKEIARAQVKLFLTEATAKQIADLKIEKDELESEIQFQERRKQVDAQKKIAPLEVKTQREALEHLMRTYVEHLKGNTIVGGKSGAIEGLEDLLGSK